MLESIAIIGVAGRGCGASRLGEVWDVLRSGRDVVRSWPSDRWDADVATAAEQPGVPQHGYFMEQEQVEGFEPLFFGISPREARYIDPQHRLALELAWEALEDAGVTRSSTQGSSTGVFMSAKWQDYSDCAPRDLGQIESHQVTGLSPNMLAHRISFALDLRGPSMVIDADGASVLVGIHLACQALRTGEVDTAIVGGVNLVLSPRSQVSMARIGALAPDGRSKAFSADADGYGRGEGGAAFVLRRHSTAVESGDSAYCVIMGSAVNSDGRGDRLTAPVAKAQAEVIRLAQARAGITPSEVDYVEAHGTGTRVGDPVELEALHQVFGAGQLREAPLLIGSAKTNLGHLEGAAGALGLLKTVLSIHHRQLPPTLHYRPSPSADLGAHGLEIVSRCRPWPRPHRPVAGVSAFGWGGTNAHVVVSALEFTPELERRRSSAPDHPALLWTLPLSATSRAALRSAAGDLASWIRSNPRVGIEDLCHTASVRRTHHPVRSVVRGSSCEELADALDSVASEREHSRALVGRRIPSPPQLCFIFPGQGGQWEGMGRGLLGRYPVFRGVIERCDDAIQRHSKWSLLAELLTPTSGTHYQSSDIQPILFAVQIALAALWRSWGVEPSSVIGHSMGEVAAAHVAGALSLEDAVRVICSRSAIAARARGEGGMAVVELSADAALAFTRRYDGRLGVAADNGTRTCVVSGDADAIDELLVELESAEVFCRRVKVDFASHSHHMDPLVPLLEEELRDVQPTRPKISMRSTVTGEVVTGASLTARYWAKHLRAPVLFRSGIEALIATGHRVFIEVSPHPSIVTTVEDIARSANVDALSFGSTRREHDEEECMLEGLARVYLAGVDPRWPESYSRGNLLRLPARRWEKTRFWHDQVDPRDETPTNDGGDDDARTPRDRIPSLEELRALAASIARLSPEQIATSTPLKELGFDSVMTMEFRARVERASQLEIPTAAAWGCPTLEAWAEYLQGHGEDNAPTARRRPSVLTAPASDTSDIESVDDLTEAEATLMLGELFRELEDPHG